MVSAQAERNESPVIWQNRGFYTTERERRKHCMMFKMYLKTLNSLLGTENMFWNMKHARLLHMGRHHAVQLIKSVIKRFILILSTLFIFSFSFVYWSKNFTLLRRTVTVFQLQRTCPEVLQNITLEERNIRRSKNPIIIHAVNYFTDLYDEIHLKGQGNLRQVS